MSGEFCRNFFDFCADFVVDDTGREFVEHCLGMGVLLLINFFDWEQSTGMNIARIVVGIVLIIYGVWRAYRQYAGIDSRY